MAGAKGRSGGARPGAGRKPKKPDTGQSVSVELEAQPHGGALQRSHAEPVPQGEKDMLQFLQEVALGQTDASALQVRAAIAAVQYTHTKMADGGKKDAKDDAAKRAANKFVVTAPPKLKVVNNR